MTAWLFMKKNYPASCDSDKMNFLEKCDHESPLHSHLDLARALARYEEREIPGMNVLKSSNWAICQEFLGNLYADNLDYARSRAGLWGYGQCTGESVDRIVTLREILTSCKMQESNKTDN
jgi:hypothetical protein